MPIKDLTERTMLPRIGKIHLGIKDPDRGFPRATDYFVLPEDHPQYRELVEAFGDKPTELRIVFPVNDEEQIASQYYRLYSRSRGLICKGDGETSRRLIDTQSKALADADSKDVDWIETECKGRDCPDHPGRCKEVMNLQFMLPEIPGLGIWQIDTSSINSILNINSGFALIRAVYNRINMVPILLSLEPKQVKSPDDQKLKTVRVMHIRSGDTLLEAAKNALMNPLHLLLGGGPLMLPQGDDERPELIARDFEPSGGQSQQADKTPEQVQKDKDELWPQHPVVEKTPQARKTQGKPPIRTRRPAGSDEVEPIPFTEGEGPPEEPESLENHDTDPPESRVDMSWLTDTAKTLGLKGRDIVAALVEDYKVDGTGTVGEVCNRLTLAQAKTFVHGLQAKLEEKAAAK